MAPDEEKKEVGGGGGGVEYLWQFIDLSITQKPPKKKLHRLR